MTYLVTGATGNAGRRVVEHLLRKGQRVGALTRNPGKGSFPEGVEVVAGDLTDPSTLDFRGITGIHLLTIGGDDYATLKTGPDIVTLAEKHGVRKIVTLWNGQSGPVEEAVEQSSLEWTHIEPTDFMSNALHWAKAIQATGKLEEPFGDSLNAAVHEADVGAVAATVLVEDGHAGKRYSVTGPEPLTPRHKLDQISDAIGRPLEFVELTEAQARARWKQAGHAEEMIDILVAWQSNPPAAAYTVTATVEDITGQKPKSFRQWAEENVDKFR
ncbi:NAD(P)H-binding protein [Kibdelosporangium philippinense]|uniref:NAD(P)H-binding protein n=1 Tax=Kibdelosporangium philippinense TaxID=211113 RepID=A0ABS8ZU96_9PSEU|nr:NAD(P)H-binding protein [Kibdelosporangium philippinense]MCE7011314.1 NAD(P)H-binding protein [Kibdelosporangium philippinense]